MSTPKELPTFAGTPEQQQVAQEVFQLMAAQGAFFADTTPIKQTLDNLVAFFANQQQRDPAELRGAIDTALSANSDIFQREQQDDDIAYVTTRQGALHPPREIINHSFKERLYQPENPLPIDDISAVVSTSRPTLTTVEPVFISDYWQAQAGLLPPEALEGVLSPEEAEAYEGMTEEQIEELANQQADAAQPELPRRPFDLTHPDVLPPASRREPVVQESESDTPTISPAWHEIAASEEAPDRAETDIPADIPAASDEASTTAEEAWLPAAAEATADAEVVEEADTGKQQIFMLDDETPVDLNRPTAELLATHGPLLRAKLLDSIDRDPLQRIVRFGREVYPGSAMVNLGKNDMRRIREDIIEAGEPLLDTRIIDDLYYQRQADNVGFRFSLNYRLSREKDFEFVGVEGARLWSVKGLPAIGTKRIKTGEMAQITSYLVEGYDDSLSEESAAEIDERGSLVHLLSFFEWSFGVLPLDARMAALLPPPLLPDQRSAVLAFESPQHYTSYLVELRYPTTNRGGWLQGLEEFFNEYLTAGAYLTIARTEEPNVFTISYAETGEQFNRILTLDQKKNKFAFSDIHFFNQVDDNTLLSQQNFGRLKNLKSLPTSERRKADMVLHHVFAVIGEQVGTRSEPSYRSDIDTLHTVYNVLRPASRSYLAALLASDEAYIADENEPGFYTYTPEPQTEEEDEEDESILGWSYEDDE